MLLTSLLPKRVYSEMKYDIVADAVHSYKVTCGSSDDDDYQNDQHLERLRQELQIQDSQISKMYLKEYCNVSVVCASVIGFWDNVSAAVCHSEMGSESSRQLTMLIDKLMVDLFGRLARRNGCITIRVVGNQVYFIAGLPAEECYEYDNYECNNTKWSPHHNGHAKNAIQMGLDLIDAVK